MEGGIVAFLLTAQRTRDDDVPSFDAQRAVPAGTGTVARAALAISAVSARTFLLSECVPALAFLSLLRFTLPRRGSRI